MEKTVVNPVTWGSRFHFVQANLLQNVDRWLVCSGQVDVDDEGQPLHAGDMSAQSEGAWRNIERLLSMAGFTLADVIHITYYCTDVDAYIEAHRETGKPRLEAAGAQPTCTLLGISRLGFKELMVEIEVVAAK